MSENAGKNSKSQLPKSLLCSKAVKSLNSLTHEN